jgi:hypothetical protein
VLYIAGVRAGAACDLLDVRPSTTLACRAYTIIIGRQTVAWVIEWLCPGRLAATALSTDIHHEPRSLRRRRGPRARRQTASYERGRFATSVCTPLDACGRPAERAHRRSRADARQRPRPG